MDAPGGMRSCRPRPYALIRAMVIQDRFQKDRTSGISGAKDEYVHAPPIARFVQQECDSSPKALAAFQFIMFCTVLAPPDTSSPNPATVLHADRAVSRTTIRSFFISILIPPDIGHKARPVAIYRKRLRMVKMS